MAHPQITSAFRGGLGGGGDEERRQEQGAENLYEGLEDDILGGEG